MLCQAMLCFARGCYDVQWYAILLCAVLCYTMVRDAVLWFAVLCCVMIGYAALFHSVLFVQCYGTPPKLLWRTVASKSPAFFRFEIALLYDADGNNIPFHMFTDYRPLVFDEFISGVWQYANHTPPPGYPLAAYVNYDVWLTIRNAAFTVS